MAKKILTIQQALDYIQSLDSDECSDEDGIICLPTNLAQVSDEENIADNDLGEMTPGDVSGQVGVKVKQWEGRNIEKKMKCKKKDSLQIILQITIKVWKETN